MIDGCLNVNCINDILININSIDEIKKIIIYSPINLKPICRLLFRNLEELNIQTKCFNLNKILLKNLPKLEILIINNNVDIINLGAVQYSNSIKILHITYDYYLYGDSVIKNFLKYCNLRYLTKLEELVLIRTPNSVLNDSLFNLKVLNISNTYIKKLPSSYINIKELNITNCKYIKNIPDSYRNLKILYANNSGIVAINNPLINLEYLYANNSNLRRININHNKFIKHIDIENTFIRKLIIPYSENLRHINIKNNRTYIIVKDNMLPNVTYLNITNNKTITFKHNKLFFPKLTELIANNTTDIIHNIIVVNKNIITKLHIENVKIKPYNIIYSFIGPNIVDLEVSSDIFFAYRFSKLKRLVLTDTTLNRIDSINLKELYLKRAYIKSISNLCNLEKLISSSYNKFPNIHKLNNLLHISNDLVHCKDKNIIKKINIDYQNAIFILEDDINIIDYIKCDKIKGLVINSNQINYIPKKFSNIEYLECNNTSIKFIHPIFKNIKQLIIYNSNIMIPKHINNIDTLKNDEVFIVNDNKLICEYILSKINNTDIECNICFEEFDSIELDCRHKLCSNCLEKIIICPFCRSKII